MPIDIRFLNRIKRRVRRRLKRTVTNTINLNREIELKERIFDFKSDKNGKLKSIQRDMYR